MRLAILFWPSGQTLVDCWDLVLQSCLTLSLWVQQTYLFIRPDPDPTRFIRTPSLPTRTLRSAPFHSFDCPALPLGFRRFRVSSAFFPPLLRSSECLLHSSMLFRTSSDVFRKNWRLPGPSGQNPFLLGTTSKEEGSGYAITSLIPNLPRPCAYLSSEGLVPYTSLSLRFRFRGIPRPSCR